MKHAMHWHDFGSRREERHASAMRDPRTLGIYKQHRELKDGHIPLSEAPGFGIEIDWEFVCRYTVLS